LTPNIIQISQTGQFDNEVVIGKIWCPIVISEHDIIQSGSTWVCNHIAVFDHFSGRDYKRITGTWALLIRPNDRRDKCQQRNKKVVNLEIDGLLTSRDYFSRKNRLGAIYECEKSIRKGTLKVAGRFAGPCLTSKEHVNAEDNLLISFQISYFHLSKKLGATCKGRTS
jgi:hypothetical protein